MAENSDPERGYIGWSTVERDSATLNESSFATPLLMMK